MIGHDFPYLDTRDLNLDWILKNMKSVLAEFAAIKIDFHTLSDKFDELLTYVNDYFHNLDVNDAISDKLDELLQDGTLQQLIEQGLNNIPIRFDSSFTDFDTAVTEALENKYTLYLTEDHSFTGEALPAIIGNGHQIRTFEQKITLAGGFIRNTVFQNTTETLSGYCLYSDTDNVSISDCTFKGYVSPLIIEDAKDVSINNCIFKNCAQGIYLKNTQDVTVSGITHYNTDEERTAYRARLNNYAGMDTLLIENSINVTLSDFISIFNIERAIYSSNSQNVTITNGYVSYGDGIKFAGYDDLVRGLNLSNVLIKNSLNGDAALQIYYCQDVNVNNLVYMTNRNTYIGWFIRAGQTIKNINISNCISDGTIRSFFSWHEDFPDARVLASEVENINIINCINWKQNTGSVGYPIIEFEELSALTPTDIYIKDCYFARSKASYTKDLDQLYASAPTYIIKLHNALKLRIINSRFIGVNNTVEFPVDLTGTIQTYINTTWNVSDRFPEFNLPELVKGSRISGTVSRNDIMIGSYQLEWLDKVIYNVDTQFTLGQALYLEFTKRFSVLVDNGASALISCDADMIVDAINADTSWPLTNHKVAVYTNDDKKIVRSVMTGLHAKVRIYDYLSD